MKKRNEEHIIRAENALNSDNVHLLLDRANGNINESYNGQIAALGVTIALTGLRPALAIYYQDGPNKKSRSKCNKREILNAIAHMLDIAEIDDADKLLRYALRDDIDLKWLKKEIIDCSVALKQVVRTYNLVSDGKS